MKLKVIKPEEIPTKNNDHTIKLNDIGFRVILIPFFGIAIPLITSMVDHSQFSLWQIKLSYLYTIGLAYVVWEGNRFLLFSLRNYFDWFDRPMRKIIALLIAIPFYTIPVTIILLVGWYNLFKSGIIDWAQVKMTTLIIMICVLFIVHVYETVFLVKEAESEKIIRAHIEKAKLEVEIEALKTQLDPHFVFNSLNALSHFIEENPAKAKLFNTHLGEVYRYLLHHKNRELVWLWEEIDFMQNYFSLLNLRFEEAIQLEVNLNDIDPKAYLIPPISLQILVENAIKHNRFSDQDPMVIQITGNTNYLVVKNTKNVKSDKPFSSGIGLQNLQSRYLLLTGKKVIILSGNSKFEVKLPVLKA